MYAMMQELNINIILIKTDRSRSRDVLSRKMHDTTEK